MKNTKDAEFTIDTNNETIVQLDTFPSRRIFLKTVTGLSLFGLVGIEGCTSISKNTNTITGDVIVPEGKSPSVFTKIIRGEISQLKIYEDNHVCAFFPREQLNVGHTLIVPKYQADSFLDVPEPYYSAVFSTSKKIGQAILESTKCARVGTLIHGFEVPHFHYHLIPMFTSSDIWKIHPEKHTEADLLVMQKKIIAALGK